MTEIIEGAVAGIEGIRQITSQSQNDRSSVSIEFEVSRDPEAATSDVRDAVSRVAGRLPDGADTPVVRKVDANASAIMWVGVTSTTLDALELSDFLKRVYVDRLSTVPGVANVYLERRAALRHAHLGRPPGARRPRPDGAGSRNRHQAPERRVARRPHRVLRSANSPSRPIPASPRPSSSSR